MSQSARGLPSLLLDIASLRSSGCAWRIWSGVFVISALLAGVTTLLVGESRVDVGVDLAGTAEVRPRLSWMDDDEVRELAPLERVASRFAPEGLQRFHARISRSALDRLVLELDGEPAASVQRVFIATLRPRIFYGSRGRPSYSSWRGAHELWQPLPTGDLRIVLPPVGELERGGFATLGALTVSLFALLGLVQVIFSAAFAAFRAAREKSDVSQGLEPFRWRTALAFALPATLVWLLYLASFYPGNGSPDVDNQWLQAEGELPLSNAHPAFHTLTLRALATLWHSPASVALAQILGLAALLGYAFTLLWRARVPRPILLAAYLLTILSPRIGLMSILLWKDVPYALMCVWLAVLLAHLLLEPRVGERALYWLALTLALTLTPAFRHNGWLVTLGVGALLPLAFPRFRSAMVLALVTTLALLLTMRLVLVQSFEVEVGDPYFSRNNAILLSALLVHEDVPLAPDELELLDRALDIDQLRVDYEWWDLDRPPGAELMRWRHFSVGRIKASESELFAQSSSLALRYASYATRYFAVATCLPYSLRVPPTRGFRNIALYPVVGFEHDSLLPEGQQLLEDFVEWSSEPPHASLFWLTGAHLLLALLALIVVVARRRDPRWVLVFLGVLLNTLSLTLALASPHVRYQFPLVLGTGFLLCLACLPRASDPSTGEPS